MEAAVMTVEEAQAFLSDLHRGLVELLQSPSEHERCGAVMPTPSLCPWAKSTEPTQPSHSRCSTTYPRCSTTPQILAIDQLLEVNLEEADELGAKLSRLGAVLKSALQNPANGLEALVMICSTIGILFRPPTHFSHMSHPTYPISHLLFRPSRTRRRRARCRPRRLRDQARARQPRMALFFPRREGDLARRPLARRDLTRRDLTPIPPPTHTCHTP